MGGCTIISREIEKEKLKKHQSVPLANIGRLLARFGPAIACNQWTCFATLDTGGMDAEQAYLVSPRLPCNICKAKVAGEKT
jgi:hypothetical protein